MGCLSENTIQELVAGVLSGDSLAEAHRHIETCAACRTLVIELARDGDLEATANPDERLTDGVSTEALLHTVAHIEDTAIAVHDLARPGALLGPYRIVRRLGRGAMGVVYEAEDPQLARNVALKVLAPLRASDDERRRRFRREARAAAAVVHPNVAAVYGVGHDRGVVYLAMEYVAGVTLRETMRRRGGPFEIAEASRIGEAIARGVGRAHEIGIVHRDLKPENVMITDTGAVKVLDFGLAKLLSSPAGARDELPWSSYTMTLDGHILGTPAYMSPEQSKGRPVDARTDVFALGVLLYELVTGTRPFRGDTAVELFIAIDRDEPPRPSAVNPHVPPALEVIVLRCLCKAPGERFASCREVAEALRRVASGEDPALGAVASGAELRLASVVRVVLPPADSSATTDAIPQERAALENLVARYGAHAAVLADGSLVATFLLQPTGARAATDLTVQAARYAFAVHDVVPDAAIVIATGRTQLAGSTPIGEAADRAVALSAGTTAAVILLDELSAGLLDGRCRVRELGAGVFALDGAALDADATRPLLGRPTPCVGRDAELATLDIALAACREDGAPRAVLVVAPPGQGKTRLGHEWIRRTEASSDPPLVLVGRADPVRGAAGGLLAQALRPALDVPAGAAPDEARSALLAAVSRQMPTSDGLHMAEMLGELCGLPFPDEGRVILRSARNDPPTMAEQVERAWLEWLRAACALRTVVLVLEDLHWGDARTASLVEAALRDLTEGALLVLALARPEVDERFPQLWGGRAQRLVLGPLGRKASERLVREALGKQADLALVERIVQLSEGNALFLEELVRAAAKGSDREAPATPMNHNREGLATLMAMLQARIERLAPEERRVLRAASILGERFRDGEVGALLGVDERKLDGWLRGLAQREVLAVHRDGIWAEHRFRHALMREAAYGTLPELERRALHHAAAEHLAQTTAEPAVVAEHFERAGLPAHAVPFFRDAATRALEGKDLAAVIEYGERAVSAGAAGEVLGNIRCAQAIAAYWRSDFAATVRFGDEALELLLVGTAAWFRAAGAAVAAAARLGDYAGVDRRFDRAAAAPCAPGAEAAQLQCLCRGTFQLVFNGRIARADEILARIVALHDAAPAIDALTTAQVEHVQGVRAAHVGGVARFLRHIEAAVAAFERAGDVRNASLERTSIAWCLAGLGEFDRAERLCRDNLARCQALRVPQAISFAKSTLGYILGYRPEARDEAVAVLGEVIDECRSVGNARLEGMACCHRATARLFEGDAAAALADAEAAVAALASVPSLQAWALALRARARIALGHAGDALADARAAVEVLERVGGWDLGESVASIALAEALAATDDHAGAAATWRQARQRLLLRADRLGDPGWRDHFLALPESMQILGEAAKAEREAEGKAPPPFSK